MLSSELVRSVLDSAPDAMIVIDQEGTVLFANHQVTALFGYPRPEIVGAKIETLLPERFRGRHVGHRSGYTRNVRVRPMGMGLELYGMRKDGTEFPVEISLSPIAQGDQVVVAAAIRDVTERKIVEQALKDAREDAVHANLAKSRFLATASHDLRQPLQTLALLNGALRRSVRDDDCLEMLQQQEQALDAMSRLLNALLDISKLESGAIKAEPVDFELADLFEELRRDFSGLAASKGLRLVVEHHGLRAHSDPALVGQLLRNLLSNALKYTPQGSVALHCETHGSRLRLAVRDTGVGIARDQVPLIFDEFYQIGVSPNSSRDGYGLGLSIVRRISRLLGLRIDVDSEPGKGSSFSFELPAADAANAEPAANPVSSGQTTNAGAAHEVLLVEDDPGVRNAMRMLLKLEGYRVTTVATAQEALELLRERDDFELVVTDYHLEPGRTGTQVISAARERYGPAIKAILVTGDTSSAIRELPSDDALRITSKPINSRILLSLMRELLAA
jgi:two-component system, sensor histidine kinase